MIHEDHWGSTRSSKQTMPRATIKTQTNMLSSSTVCLSLTPFARKQMFRHLLVYVTIRFASFAVVVHLSLTQFRQFLHFGFVLWRDAGLVARRDKRFVSPRLAACKGRFCLGQLSGFLDDRSRPDASLHIYISSFAVRIHLHCFRMLLTKTIFINGKNPSVGYQLF